MLLELAAAICAGCLLLLGRIIWVLKQGPPRKRSEPGHIMILLGSGGHTGEMLRLLKAVHFDRYALRTYVHYPEDTISITKALELDESQTSTLPSPGKALAIQAKRARNVGQSWSSTVWSSLESLQCCFSIVSSDPDVIVTNGPGTAVMLCGASLILKVLGFTHSRLVYVESLARVTDLSLSGKLLLPIANRFIVQWPQLAKKYPQTEYYGILV